MPRTIPILMLMLATPLAAHAQSAPPVVRAPPPIPVPAPPSAIRSERAYALAQLLNSEALTRRQLPGLARQLGDQFRADVNIAPVEQEYPGSIDYLIAAIMPDLERMAVEKAPGLWRELGSIYANAMTEAELDATVAFYRSPTGAKLIDAIVDNMDYSAMMQDVARNDYEGDITAGSIDKMMAQTVNKTLPKAMSGKDRIALLAFGQTSAFAKLSAIRPRLTAKIAEYSNRRDPQMEGAIEKISIAALTEFIAAQDEKRVRKPAEVLAAELR